MKKAICVMLMIALICTMYVPYVFGASDIKLYVMQKEISFDTPPMIVNSRTLVPVRAVFTGLDAEVEWDGNNKVVTVEKDKTNISFKVGSEYATVNSSSKKLDAAPVIVNDRCMIPIRFVSENLGYDVLWDADERAVHVNEKKKELSNVKKINVVKNSTNNAVSITFDNIAKASVMTLENPFRIVADFENSALSMGDGNSKVDSGYIKEVRWAKHDDDCRIVIECSANQPYEISTNDDVYSIKVGNASSKIEIDDEKDKDDDTTDEDVVVEKRDPNNLLVVLDAGHGGTDPGALGKDEAGNTIINEKDVNLSIALKVRDILVKNGVQVKMTRETDKFVPLMDIADFANKNDADLFVSIHNNAIEDPSISGTLVMYYDTETKNSYGIKSSYVAETIRDAVLDETSLVKRNNPNSPRILVLNQTKMPAVLVECAFVTNESDRNYLNSNKGISEIATGIANGIMESLETYKDNLNKK